MSAAPELFQLPTRCEFCGARVRFFPTAAQVEKWRHEPPAVLAHTYQCAWEIRPRQKCNNIVRIYAKDYQEATRYGG